MKTKVAIYAAVLLFVAEVVKGVLTPQCLAVTIDWVTVGDPGNVADTRQYSFNRGSVPYSFQIMKYEWTNSQYVAFLNAVDPEGTNPNGIYSTLMAYGIVNTGIINGGRYATIANMDDKPVVGINLLRAARVANWMHGGGLSYQNTAAGSAAINVGAYTLSGSSVTLPGRNADARYWIPTDNEWYKAAYFKGSGTNTGYWTFPTQFDAVPAPVAASANGNGKVGGISPVTSGNFGNFFGQAIWNGEARVTSVGTNGGPSAYGAFDMGGNVWEMTFDDGDGSRAILRGGYFLVDGSIATYANLASISSTGASGSVGLRLAGPAPIPEVDPAGLGSVLALVTGSLGLLERRRRRCR